MDSRVFEFTMRDAPNHAATIGRLVAGCDSIRWCNKFIQRIQVIAPNAFDAEGKMHPWADTDGYLRRIAAEIVIEAIKMGSGYTEEDMRITITSIHSQPSISRRFGLLSKLNSQPHPKHENMEVVSMIYMHLRTNEASKWLNSIAEDCYINQHPFRKFEQMVHNKTALTRQINQNKAYDKAKFTTLSSSYNKYNKDIKTSTTNHVVDQTTKTRKHLPLIMSTINR
ncbi:unnamed protein product [Ambrosiozyma monospora]|uniref:Unnamed protein product n=1 Tax=Ambrosiozyma monospora TaxID=43982 RepID=A0A9W6YYN9_AMBMO|nr:unnamed protein product [Ambrosiozyma monospora]